MRKGPTTVVAVAVTLLLVSALAGCHAERRADPRPTPAPTDSQPDLYGTVTFTFQGEEPWPGEGGARAGKLTYSASLRYRIGEKDPEDRISWPGLEAVVHVGFDVSVAKKGYTRLDCDLDGTRETEAEDRYDANMLGNATVKGLAAIKPGPVPSGGARELAVWFEIPVARPIVTLGEINSDRDMCIGVHEGPSRQPDPPEIPRYGWIIVPEVGAGHFTGTVSADDAGNQLNPPYSSGLAATTILTSSAVVDLFLVPKECRPTERTTSRLEETEALLADSARYRDLKRALGDKWQLQHNVARQDPGEGGRTYLRDDGVAVTEIAKGVGSNQIDDAATLGHEQQHAADLQRIGASFEKVAPYLSAEEFVTLLWESESRGFEAERQVLDQLVTAHPDLRRCYEFFTQTDSWHRAPAGTERDRALTRKAGYTEGRYRAAHDAAAAGDKTPEGKAGAERVRNDPAWKAAMDRWTPLMHLR